MCQDEGFITTGTASTTLDGRKAEVILCLVGHKSTEKWIHGDAQDIDMTESFSILRAKSKGAPISFKGKDVYGIYSIPVTGSEKRFRFKILNVRNDQCINGISLKCYNGVMDVNKGQYRDIFIWSDTCPKCFDFTITPKTDCILKLWNVWRIGEDVNAWLNNAGMLVDVDETNDAVTFQCNHGYGKDINFGQFIVEIKEVI